MDKVQHVVLPTKNGSYSAMYSDGANSVDAVANALGVSREDVKRFLHCSDDSTAVYEPDDDGCLAMIRGLCLSGYAQAKEQRVGA